MNAQQQRLEENRQPDEPWYRWGSYLSDRQWGSVWDYLPHDQARSRAYRWGEDGLERWYSNPSHNENWTFWCASSTENQAPDY